MLQRIVLSVSLLLVHLYDVQAQFAPPAGQPGSTAIYKDSSIIVGWASSCTVQLGWQDASNTSLGFAAAGDSSMATGPAGTNGTVSLGDGGCAIVTFNFPIYNGPGFDFCVFENAFDDLFLELAFVEVSSDGVNYFRFPVTSYTQDSVQTSSFGYTDASKIDNLAGKYRVNYGTPFDLELLANIPGLNVNAVTHIKICDVIGSINTMYATYDQYGNLVNDPWPTPFPSSGFDLDAVGAIHLATGILDIENTIVNVFPNPAVNFVQVSEVGYVMITDVNGRIVHAAWNDPAGTFVSTENWPNGLYFLTVQNWSYVKSCKLMVQHD